MVTLEVRNFVAKGEGDEDENVPNRFVSETVRGRERGLGNSNLLI